MKLGIVPEELLTGNYKVEHPVTPVPRSRSKSNKTETKSINVDGHNKIENEEVSGTEEEFKKLMSEGESEFRAGHYGKAIAVYEKVGRIYARLDQQNSHRYWVALCWYKLKELAVAKDQFENFIKSTKNSPWLPRAEFYLARIDIENGMLQSALKGFRGIIKNYPYDDTSEMARMEIERIEQRL